MIKKRIISIASLSLLLLFFGAYQVSSQSQSGKPIYMGGSDYRFIFEDRIILGEEDDQKPTSTRLFVSGAAEFTESVIAALPNFSNELVPKSYVDPYLTFWNVLGDGHIHNATDGRVGINMIVTSTPQAQLQVNAPSGVEGLRLVTSDFSPLNIRNSADTADIWRIDQTGSLATGTIPWARVSGVPANFGSNWLVSGSNIYRLTGNVGIGTTSPSAMLELFRDAGRVQLKISAQSGGTFDPQLTFAINRPVPVEFFSIGVDNSDSDKFKIVSGSFTDGISDTGLLTIIGSTGNIGVGTNAPLQKLHVNGRTLIGDTNMFPNAELQVYESSAAANSTVYGLTSYIIGSGSGTGTQYANYAVSQLGGNRAASYGTYSRVVNTGTISINNAYGVYGEVMNNLSALSSVTNAYGVYSYVNAQDGNIANAYGFYGNLQNATGSIGTAYGLYLNIPTVLATNRWGLYINSNANSYLGSGNIGIGTTTLTAGKLVIDDGTGVAINTSGGEIKGLPDTPTDQDSATSKAYVDDNFVLQGDFSSLSPWKLSGNNLYASSTDWNVGIGTTAPGAKLSVVGTAGTTSSGAPLAFSVVGGYGGNEENYGWLGGAISLVGGQGGSSMGTGGHGGGISLTAGNGGNGSMVGNGGSVAINGGNGFLGGSIILNGGSGTMAGPGNVILANTFGNVGIGTSSPSEKLQVSGNTFVTGSLILGAAKVSSIRESWGVNMTGSNIRPFYTNTASLMIGYAQTDNTVRGVGNLFVSGNVGINTTTPQYHLHTNGDAYFTGTTRVASPIDDDQAVPLGYVSPYLTFWNTEGNDHVYSVNEGRVGINMNLVDVPGAQLQVNAPSGVEGLRIVSASDYSPLNIRNSANTADIWRIDQTGSLATGTIPWARVSGIPANFGSNWEVSGGNIYRLTGNVGIGTTSPNQALHIVGRININDNKDNVYIGSSAGVANTTGDRNTAIGTNSMSANTTGFRNAAIGRASLISNTTGSYNSALGLGAISGNVSGSNNIGIGHNAGTWIADGVTMNQSSNQSIYIGASSRSLSGNNTNEIVIGYEAIGQGSNSAVYGNTLMTKHIFSHGNVGIGTTTPTTKLSVFSDISGNFIHVNGGYISGLDHTPFDPDHAVPLAYLESNYISTSTISDSGGWTVSGNNVYNSNSGNVGIGTTNPGSKLEVNGDINLATTSNTFKVAGNTVISFNNTTQSLAIGLGAGSFQTGDVAIGNGAGQTSSATYNVAIGDLAGSINTGQGIIVLGQGAGRRNTGDGLVALGFETGLRNDGDFVSVIGRQAGYTNTGNYLTAFGYNAGYLNSGAESSFFGSYAGRENTGANSIGVGFEANRLNTANNVIAIGYQAGKSNSVANQFIVKQTNINNIPLIQGNFLTGNVGIGTTTPTTKLSVFSDISGNFIHVNGGYISGLDHTPFDPDHAVPLAYLESNYISTSSASGLVVAGTVATAASTAAKVATISNYTLTTGDFLAITFTNGNSISSPTLNINGAGAKNIRLSNSNVDTTNFSLAASAVVLLYYDGNFFRAMGSQRLVDSNTTYSEITEAEIDAGTASTARALSGRRAAYIINKSVNKTGGTMSGNLIVNADVTANAFYYNSDIRLKENIISLNSSLDKIKKLNPVSFTWKADGRIDQGFIAQELELVVPELVKTNSETGLKSVQYGNLTALLTAGMQEQERKIEQLQTEIEILKLRLNSLEK